MTEWLNAGVCLAQKWQIGCLCQKVIRWLDWMCDLTIDVSDSCRCILLPLLVYLFVLSSIHFFTHSLSQSVGQPVSRSLTHSLTQSVSRSVSHSVDVHVATKAILQFDRTRHLGSFAPAFRGEVMVAKGKLHATRILRTWKWLRSQLEAGKQRNLVHRLSLSILKYLKEWFFDFSVGVSRPLQLNLANLFQSWLFFPQPLVAHPQWVQWKCKALLPVWVAAESGQASTSTLRSTQHGRFLRGLHLFTPCEAHDCSSR